MISKFISLIKTYIAARKAQQVKDVITQFTQLVDAQVLLTIPTAVAFYQRSAHALIDKTVEAPEPALQLITALDACVKHYGPTVKEEFAKYQAELEIKHSSPVVKVREAQLKAALDELNK